MTAVYRKLSFMNYPRYRVGTDGSVWRWKKTKREWKQLTPVDSCGRMLLNLSNDDGPKTFSVHRLILFAFVGMCPEGMEACHNDGNHQNNCVNNLRWDTHVNNEKDKKRHGTHNEGTRHYGAKLTEDQVREIRIKYAGGDYSLSQLAKEYKIAIMTVQPLIKRRTWKNVR